MLRHHVGGLVERVVITHRRSGARADLTVTLASAAPESPYSVRVAADPCFAARRAGDWAHLRCHGALACWRVAYTSRPLYPGMPTVFVEAPYALFAVRFEVIEPHPDFPDGTPPGRKEARHAGT